MSKSAISWLLPGLLLFSVIIGTNSGPSQHCCIPVPGTKNGSLMCCTINHAKNNTRCCEVLDNQTVDKINLAAFIPKMVYDSYRYKQAMLMAMDIINNRTDILKDYEVVLHIVDTIMGHPGKALYGLFNWLNKPPVKHMIIGPAFTAAVQPVAVALSQWNLISFAYASVSEETTGYLYQNLYRMVPTTFSFNLAKIAFLKRFKWKRVAVLHSYDAKVFSPAVRNLQTLLQKNNISTITVEGFQMGAQMADVSFQIKKLKSMDARIIVGEFNDIDAREVFCEVYKQKLYGPKYVWIVFGLLVPKTILKLKSVQFRTLECTREQMKEVIQGMFGMGGNRLRKDNITTFSGLTANQYIKDMKSSRSELSTYAFDSVFTAARVLNKSSLTSCPPQNFTYTSRNHLKILNRLLKEETFEGVSGPVRFGENDRYGGVYIAQIQNESWEVIGQHLTFADKLEFNDESTIWPDDRVPKDRMIRKEELLTNDLTLIIVIWLLAIVGTFLSLAFLYFNISYRENRLIKMSSPQLNNVIILGCLLCYVSTILFGLDARFLAFETYGINCNARTAVMSIGFSLAFGAMFSKTWRVHKIFTAAKTLKKMAIKDIHLFGIVAALVVIDVCYLSLWFGFDPLKATKLHFTLQEKTSNDVIYIPVLYQCTCQYKTYFIAAMYAYKGILLLFGLFLAWETRNVTIPALNDSKYIGMSVYNVVTLSLIGAIVTTALDNTIHYEAPYAISSLCLIICTTATLLLVFVPKVYSFILGSEDQSFNTATINNGVTTTMGRGHGSHAFRFESESGKPKQYSTKSVQTNHLELSGSADNNTEQMNNKKNNNINQGFDIQMDDIELDESSIPKTRYNQQLTENGLVTFMLTDM